MTFPALQLTRTAAQRLLLAAQGLDRRGRLRPAKADLLRELRRMHALQVDTIHVVARSPYLVLFSRLGAYPPRWLEELLAEGRLFEYWAHEACFLPIEDYPLFRHRMDSPHGMGWKYRAAWVKQHRHELENVLQHLRERGEARSADFERRSGQAGGWWEWKPEKRALEALFTAGEVMVARRHNFQRVYDIRERVHPGWNDSVPARAEAERLLVLNAVRALGVATTRWAADYFRMERSRTHTAIEALLSGGELAEVRVEGVNDVAYVDSSKLELVRAAADGGLTATRTTFLSPFDPVVWDRARLKSLFGFEYTLECYVPSPKRRWGYFVLPLLRRGRLIGRMDAKAHRADGRFEVKVLYLEEGVRVSDALVRDIAGALRELAAWHGTPDVDVRRTDPPPLKALLKKALS